MELIRSRRDRCQTALCIAAWKGMFSSAAPTPGVIIERLPAHVRATLSELTSEDAQMMRAKLPFLSPAWIANP